MNHPDQLSSTIDTDCPVNIVISGTTLWNPGDDFVREGVIAILRAHYHPRLLNLFFYNFSADTLPPHGKQGGIGNCVGPGDLVRLGAACDAVVIAGLSAGHEIKPLYEWVIEAGLTDRVVMIGAGYENEYVEKHCTQEPEATIFANARLITGRTEKKPWFLESLGTPYVHLPCPSILGANGVKEVAPGAEVRRIGFSIQLPHERGIVNQATGATEVELATETMLHLAERYDITLIAHHKTEYLDHLARFRHPRIQIVFQSFVQDLARTYRSLDLMLTTRLHAGLGANAYGIPALIINNTDRHTHALDGFHHAFWAADRAGVDGHLGSLLNADLHAVSVELRNERRDLMTRYLGVLGGALSGPRVVDQDRVSRESVARRLMAACGSVPVKHRVLSVLRTLTEDVRVRQSLAEFAAACRKEEGWSDALSVLSWWARAMRPRTYLEIGVRRAGLLAQVLTESPATHAWGFDLGPAECGSIPEQCIHAEHTDPDFVRRELRRAGVPDPIALLTGCSRTTLPAFLASTDAPDQFDLIFVDADRAADGVHHDLRYAFAQVAPGGAVLFGDISRPVQPELTEVWESFKDGRSDWMFIEDRSRNGIMVAVRPPFGRLLTRLDAWSRERCQALLEAEPIGSEPGAERLMRRLLRPGMTAVDVGAHAGRYTRTMSLLVGPQGRVLSLEPNPTTASRLRDMVRSRGLDNVAVEQVAASDADCIVVLNEYGDPRSSWSTMGNPEHRLRFHDPSTVIPIESSCEVRAQRLASLLERHGIDKVDYLKIDAEGAEPLVLKGLGELLDRSGAVYIQFEISRATIVGMGQIAKTAFDELTSRGYRVHAITECGGVGDEVRDTDAVHQQFIAIASGRSVRPCGADRKTPIHFFTIVLNGVPFLERHIEQFRLVEGPWHWHIIEGVSELVRDTAWSLGHGGRIPHDLHHAGRSIDGTTEYLDRIASEFPEYVSVYRKPPGRFWDGKLEMVNAALASIHEPCLLWQIDADEMWTTEQIHEARRMFAERPEATAAFYRCHYFVGPDKVITSENTYGNHTDSEWVRTWRFTPGCRWEAHEPPRLMKPTENGWRDLARIRPLMHHETLCRGLVFQHYAYATEAQLRFKESYYGYAGAVEQWRRLQRADSFPVMLRDYFSWVRDETTVDLASAIGVKPMMDIGTTDATKKGSPACTAS